VVSIIESKEVLLNIFLKLLPVTVLGYTSAPVFEVSNLYVRHWEVLFSVECHCRNGFFILFRMPYEQAVYM
jgi:hypothetical protein